MDLPNTHYTSKGLAKNVKEFCGKEMDKKVKSIYNSNKTIEISQKERKICRNE